MPVEARLEFVPPVGTDLFDPEREPLENVVDEVDGRVLIVSAVDLQRWDTGRVIDRRVLIPPHGAALRPRQAQELHIELDLVTGKAASRGEGRTG